MTFVHQALTWGFLLALVPLLIHLINLMRRRRVQWAAMEFLLRSYKKHRKWIWLKQLLLLLMRMAVIALIVAMLAQWITKKEWLAIFGGTTTHHFVLLDDSFSMSERLGGASAFDKAKQALGEIAHQAVGQDSPQKFTVLRFSRAAAAAETAEDDADPARIADLNAEIVDANFDVLIEEKRRAMELTELATGPREALVILNQLLEQNSDENNLVYVLSDFRDKEWGTPNELAQLLREADKAAAEIHFVSCVKKQQQNLTLTDLTPEEGTRAAGVPLFVNVSVRNNGTIAAHNVQAKVRTHFFDPDVARSGEPGKLIGKLDEPPTVLFDEIPPGKTATRRVQVYFPRPGPQVVEAILADDVVSADNRRWCVVNLAAGEPVLVVDGSLDKQHAYFLASAFSPGQRTNTGIMPDVQVPDFLRNATPDDLRRYHAIYLLDVDRFDKHVVDNLEQYVRDGGGIGIFVGEDVNRQFYSEQLYRNGAGLLPLPLERDAALADELVENLPDFEVEDHPVFSVFFGERNPFIRLVSIEHYLAPPDDWLPPDNSPVEVLARLRNGDPLAVEKRLGDGRVIIFLTTLAPQWNNWAHDPSFVVALLKLQSYLAQGSRHDDQRTVGSPIALKLNAEKYLKDVSFVTPGLMDDQPTVVERIATKTDEESPFLSVTLDRTSVPGPVGAVDRSGIYEAWAPTREGSFDVRRYALNVDPSEGDLAFSGSQPLLARLEPLAIDFRHADEYAYDLMDQAGYNRSLLVMAVLLAMLLGEQLLAYSASYHPVRGAVR